MSSAAQLARLRVAIETGRLPSDLGRWALERLTEFASAADRAELRNALIRQAAELCEGSTWAKAHQLQAELVAAKRQSLGGEIRELLAEALEIDPACPCSVRQLTRILGDTEGAIPVTRNR